MDKPTHARVARRLQESQCRGGVDFVIFERMPDRVPDASTREMENRVDPIDNAPQQRLVPQIAADDFQAAVAGSLLDIFFAAGRKVVDDSQIAVGEHIGEMRADKARPAGQKNGTTLQLQRAFPDLWGLSPG